MIIYILDKNKITKYYTPKIVDDMFVINYYPENQTDNVLINIEVQNQSLIVKSNGSANIIENGMWTSKTIEYYSFIKVQISETKEEIFLYAAPIVENNFLCMQIPANRDKITIGSGQSCDIVFNESNIMEVHAQIIKENGNYFITNVNNTTIYLNKRRIEKEILRIGDIIFINGMMIVFMGGFLKITNPMNKVQLKDFFSRFEVPTQDNSKYNPLMETENNIELYNENEYFFHTPYIKNSLTDEFVQIDPPPASQRTEELPFLLTVGSSLTMIAYSLVSGYNIAAQLLDKSRTVMQLLPSIVTCVAMIVGSVIVPRLIKSYQKNKQKKREKLRQTKYTEYLNEKAEQIKMILVEQTQTLKLNYMSTDECYAKITMRNKSIWQREISDSDFLVVRLGIGDVDAKLKISAPEEHFSLDDDNLQNKVFELVENSKKLVNVPIVYNLSDENSSAIINYRGIDYGMLESLIIQLVSYHSSGDLKLVFFVRDSKKEYWEYVKYLPHVWSDDKSIRFFATNIDEMKTVSNYLEEEYNNRASVQDSKGTSSNNEKSYQKYSPYYLIITDNCKVVKDLQIITNILGRDTNCGFSILFADSTLKNLPNGCSSFILEDGRQGQVMHKEAGGKMQDRFAIEPKNYYDMENLSLVLGNIPVLPREGLSELPQSITFLQMYNVGRIEQLNIYNRWQNNNPIISLKAPVGVHANKDIFELDLHEKFHGPHGLIAGSTGSGKSEFIITYILSLAINYHPYEVQFVLIDYKGGGLAGAFENRENNTRLPHLVGTITNLDTSEMNRTLVSIESELKRRQIKFNEVRDKLGESTIDIYKYQKLYRDGTIDEPISHLFIISDEFAELKKQQPEFMNQLISIARIGRSLGIHLILATQKPSGIVNDQIWSNSKFKVCLKVQDRSDSMEVLKKPDAASIKEVGRFILQVGYDEYYSIGQSGWAGAKYVPTDMVVKKIDDSISFVNNVGYVTSQINTALKEESTEATGDQLTNITKYIIELAKKSNIKTSKLWLDSIPEEIYLEDLIKKYNYQSAPYKINPLLGEYDVPSMQYQNALTIDLTDSGNTLIYGMPGSGKENLILTLVYSSCLYHGPEEVNFYILDFGSESLKVLRKFPQVGDILLAEDGEKIVKLFNMISSEIERRKDLFSDYAGSYLEYIKNSGKKEPLITVIINNWEVFTESYGRIADLIYPFIRDGNKYGIAFIFTATTTNSIRTRMAQTFLNKIALKLPDDSDYRGLLNSPRGLYPADKFGRGLVAMDKTAYEFQTAYICSKEGITGKIREEEKRQVEIYKEKCAPKIPILPNVVSTDMVFNEKSNLTSTPIGIEKESLKTYVWDFTLNPVTIISSTDMENHNAFMNALIKEFAMTRDIKTKIIDVVGYFKSIYSGIYYYSNNFNDVLKMIYNELQTEINNEYKSVYIIAGIGKLKDKLDEVGKEYYMRIFDNVNNYQNSVFIFSDNADNYKTVQIESWYRTHVDNTFGIWLGEDIGIQNVINVKNVELEDKKLSFPYMAFPVYRGDYMILKYITEGVAIQDEE